MSSDHPAIIKAQGIYDCPDDLTEGQQAFLAEVDAIRWAKVRSYQTINFVYGDLPAHYRANLIIADKQCNDRLAAALDRYELSLVDSDTEAFPFELAAE